MLQASHVKLRSCKQIVMVWLQLLSFCMSTTAISIKPWERHGSGSGVHVAKIIWERKMIQFHISSPLAKRTGSVLCKYLRLFTERGVTNRADRTWEEGVGWKSEAGESLSSERQLCPLWITDISALLTQLWWDWLRGWTGSHFTQLIQIHSIPSLQRLGRQKWI
jgi:hypothetical protein